MWHNTGFVQTEDSLQISLTRAGFFGVKILSSNHLTFPLPPPHRITPPDWPWLLSFQQAKVQRVQLAYSFSPLPLQQPVPVIQSFLMLVDSPSLYSIPRHSKLKMDSYSPWVSCSKWSLSNSSTSVLYAGKYSYEFFFHKIQHQLTRNLQVLKYVTTFE